MARVGVCSPSAFRFTVRTVSSVVSAGHSQRAEIPKFSCGHGKVGTFEPRAATSEKQESGRTLIWKKKDTAGKRFQETKEVLEVLRLPERDTQRLYVKKEPRMRKKRQ